MRQTAERLARCIAQGFDGAARKRPPVDDLFIEGRRVRLRKEGWVAWPPEDIHE
jgi:hypothetical protein